MQNQKWALAKSWLTDLTMVIKNHFRKPIGKSHGETELLVYSFRWHGSFRESSHKQQEELEWIEGFLSSSFIYQNKWANEGFQTDCLECGKLTATRTGSTNENFQNLANENYWAEELFYKHKDSWNTRRWYYEESLDKLR